MNRTLRYRRSGRLVSILALTLLCVGFVSCRAEKSKSEASSKERQLIVGFSQIGAESAWRKCNTRSIRDAAESYGIQLLFDNAEQKQENQIKAIRSFIAYRVDVIAFVPIVSDGWENVLREARDAGIPVLITDRKIRISEEGLHAGFIGTDSFEEGRNAGRFLVRKFLEKNPTRQEAAKQVRVFELTGTIGSSVATGRAMGFREVIANHPEIEIVHSESGDFLRSKGYEIAKRCISDLLVVDAIYSHNDSMTLGVIDALKEAGIAPGKDVVIITIDAEQASIDALRRGEVNCVIECNPKTGPAIMDLAVRLAEGESIPWIVHVDEQVFTEFDNDLDAIESRGY